MTPRWICRPWSTWHLSTHSSKPSTPFLDGNGRIGRLLIAALFEHWGLLREPLMYLSGYLKQHRAEYYRRLSTIRTEGDWESWCRSFSKAWRLPPPTRRKAS